MSAESAPVAREDLPRTVEAMLIQYRGMLNALAYRAWRLNRDHAEIGDFRSVADVAAWKAFERYDPSRGKALIGWVYDKAQGALRDYVRVLVGLRSPGSNAHVRRESVELDAVFLLASPGSTDSAAALARARLRGELRELLTDAEADTVLSVYFGGFSQTEIARKRRCTESNISQIHKRAIERLRREFAA